MGRNTPTLKTTALVQWRENCTKYFLADFLEKLTFSLGNPPMTNSPSLSYFWKYLIKEELLEPENSNPI